MSDLANELFAAGCAMNKAAAESVCPDMPNIPPPPRSKRRVPVAIAIDTEDWVWIIANDGTMLRRDLCERLASPARPATGGRMSEYATFLDSKRIVDQPTGLATVPELNAMLFPFQRDIVGWALRRGRAASFADCGRGNRRGED